MNSNLPRFAAEFDFPPYTYIPGVTPHPVSDPAGHSYGDAADPIPSRLDDWQRSAEYRQGIDLFNHGFYWESHEVWEGLWHAVGRSEPLAQVLQGLIKLAAAGVKTLAGSIEGRRRHSLRAAALFAQAATAPEAAGNALRRASGLDLTQLERWAREAASDERVKPPPTGTEPTPRRVFEFLLVPSVGDSSSPM